MEQTHPSISAEEDSKTDSEEKGKIKKDLPFHPVELVRATKAGSLTIPRHVRETLPEKALFAFWTEGDKLIFQKIEEEDVEHLSLKNKSAKGEKRSSKPSNRRRKKPKTPSITPELTKYFLFPFENQDKVATLLESAFYKFVEDPPNVNEGLDILKYIIVTYTTGQKINDARLKNAIINCIEDLTAKKSHPDYFHILQFIREKILPEIHSRFLREQSLITAFVSAARIGDNSSAKEFLKEIIEGINSYGEAETFAIMQGWKTLVNTIRRAGLELPHDMKKMIANNLMKYIPGARSLVVREESLDLPLLTPSDSLQLIDLIKKLNLIEDAYNATEELLHSLSPDDKDVHDVRKTLNELKNIPL